MIPRMDDHMDMDRMFREYQATQRYIAVILTLILLIKIVEVFH